jgi:WD40 repeat protein
VLSGSDDKTVKLWNLVTGKLVHTFEGHAKEVTSVTFSPDGRTALSGSYDRTSSFGIWRPAN